MKKILYLTDLAYTAKGRNYSKEDIIKLSEETLETKRLYDSIQWEPAVLL